MAVMDGLKRCGTILLEPIIRARLTVPERALQKIIGELVARRATWDFSVTRGDKATLKAEIPLAETEDFPATLAARTAGEARLVHAPVRI